MMFGIEVRATILKAKCSPALEYTKNYRRLHAHCKVLGKSFSIETA